MTEPNKSVSKWAPIVGRWNLTDLDQIVYLGPQQDQQLIPYGICVSNMRFSEGEVHLNVRLASISDGPGEANSARLLLGYRSQEQPYLLAGLGGRHAFAITRHEPGLGWRDVAVAGSNENLVPNQEYLLTLRVNGQRLVLEVDSVPVLDHVLDAPLVGGQLGLFAKGNSQINFNNPSIKNKQGTAFVIMQFSDVYQNLYDDVIKPTVEGEPFKLHAYHAGEVFSPGIILDDIVRGIIESKIIIAEITPPNQNVFYELGYAHALRKPTILLAETGKALPFDISGYRCLFYENSIAGKRKIEEGLQKHLQGILNQEAEIPPL